MCHVHGTLCEFPTAASGATHARERPRTPRTRPSRTRRPDSRATSKVASSAAAVGYNNNNADNHNDPTLGHRKALSASVTSPTPPAGRYAGFSPRDGSASHFIVGLGSQEDDESSHIVGPAVTSDTQILADYLRAEPSAGGRLARMARPGRNHGPGSDKPVMFARIRKHPVGKPLCQSTASMKCEIVEKILEPWTEELVDLYFMKVNTCFPLLDESSFKEQYKHQRHQISPALLVNLYAHTLVFWPQTRASKDGKQCPDGRFIWNQANDALSSELQLSPGISTVIAILLNVGGRPTTSMIGNGIMLGSAVSIAHGLGLHRDPTDWDIAPSEKSLRIRIWWALVIHDKWFSLAYGTPSHLQSSQYDIPKPSPELLFDPGASRSHTDADSVFIALVALTEVLDTHIVYLYDLRQNKGTRNTRAPLDQDLAMSRWEESLSSNVRRIVLHGTTATTTTPHVPGAINLRLAYLSIRLLQRRTELDAGKQQEDHHGPSGADPLASRRHIQARRGAEDIVLLVQELAGQQLDDFWLPAAAFALASTAAFLLRCALETEESGLARSPSLGLAGGLVAALRAHQRAGWELGDVCLAQYGELVGRLAEAGPAAVAGREGEAVVVVPDLQELVMSNVPDIDELFPSLWDMFNTP